MGLVTGKFIHSVEETDEVRKVAITLHCELHRVVESAWSSDVCDEIMGTGSRHRDERLNRVSVNGWEASSDIFIKRAAWDGQ